MSSFEVMFHSDDAGLRRLLAETNALPEKSIERLTVTAGLCQWWADRCNREIGAAEARDRQDRMDRNRVARAAATRAANKARATTSTTARKATSHE